MSRRVHQTRLFDQSIDKQFKDAKAKDLILQSGVYQYEAIQTMKKRRAALFHQNDTKLFSRLQPLLMARGGHAYWKDPSLVPTGSSVPCEGGVLCEHAGCQYCIIPAGTWVRVVKKDSPMDRDTSDKATEGWWDIPKEQCVFCALHCGMRVTECLFKPIKKYAQEKNKITEVNAILREYGVHYQIKKTKSKVKSARSVTKPPKFQGGECEKVCDAIPALLRALYGIEPGEQYPEDPQVKLTYQWQIRVWHNWCVVFKKMFEISPTPEEVAAFPKDVTAFASSLIHFSGGPELSALYLHIVVGHARTLMKMYGSLGKWMQQGCEAKHIGGKKAFQRVGHGGMWGQVQKAEKVINVVDVDGVAQVPTELEKLEGWIKPENPERWSQRQPFTVPSRPEQPSRREVLLGGLKSPTMYLVFQQLLIVNIINTRFFCKKCDGFADCEHSSLSQFGLFTPNKMKAEYISAEAKFRVSQILNPSPPDITDTSHVTPPQSPSPGSASETFVAPPSPRLLPWPSQVATPFGTKLEALGLHVVVPDVPEAVEGTDGQKKRTPLGRQITPVPPVYLHFPITRQDLEHGFLEGPLTEQDEFPQFYEGSATDPDGIDEVTVEIETILSQTTGKRKNATSVSKRAASKKKVVAHTPAGGKRKQADGGAEVASCKKSLSTSLGGASKQLPVPHQGPPVQTTKAGRRSQRKQVREVTFASTKG
jgi:hypothetical protein